MTRVVWRDRVTGRKVSRRCASPDAAAAYVAALLDQSAAEWVRVES